MKRGFRLPAGIAWEDVKEALWDEYRSKPRKYIPEWAMAASLALLTGRRRGEIALLLWENINFKRNTIVWHIEKKGSLRVVEMPAGRETMNIIRRRRALRGRPPKKERVVPGNPRSWSVGLKRWARKHGWGELRFHDLRHLYALRLLGQGAPLPVVRIALQHSSLKTTTWYLEMHPEELRDWVI